MVFDENSSRFAEQPKSADQPNDSVLRERVQELTWALLDEQISADEMQLLDSLLLSDGDARRTYVSCVQLHADLAASLHQAASPGQAPFGHSSPILGFLHHQEPPVNQANA